MVLDTLRTSLAIAALAALVAPAAFAADGKTTFIANCSSCHGETGKGDGPVGAVLTPKPRDFSVADFKFDTDSDGKTGTDTDLKNVIQKGSAAFGGSPLMAPWPTLSDADVEAIIGYIRTLKK